MGNLRSDQRAWLVSWTYQWLDAVDRQAQRVQSAPNNGMGQVEILLFVVALRNVLRGSEAILGRRHSAVCAFHRSVPAAKDIRDMLDHFDEYVLGAGRLQKGGPPSDWLVYYSSEHEVGGERAIHIDGHTLRVDEAAEAAKVLARAAINGPSITPVSGNRE